MGICLWGSQLAGYAMLTTPGHTAIIHALVFLVAVGYAQNYYFHLRKFCLKGFGSWCG